MRRQELLTVSRFARKLFPDEDVLLVDGVPFAQRLRKGGEQVCEVVVTVNVRRIFLYRILYLKYGGIFAGLGVQHTHTVRFLRREIDVLKDSLALAARTERIDRQGHTRAQSDKT